MPAMAVMADSSHSLTVCLTLLPQCYATYIIYYVQCSVAWTIRSNDRMNENKC